MTKQNMNRSISLLVAAAISAMCLAGTVPANAATQQSSTSTASNPSNGATGVEHVKKTTTRAHKNASATTHKASNNKGCKDASGATIACPK